MKGKILFVVGAATGYVLGSRAGRSAYERIKVRANKLWNSDQVQSGLGTAKTTIADKAPVVGKKAKDAASSVKDSVTGSDSKSGTDSSSGSNSGSGTGSDTTPGTNSGPKPGSNTPNS